MRYKQFGLFDVDESTGEVTPIRTTTEYKGSELGDEWIVNYKRGLNDLVDKGASYSALRIYLKLMSMQTFHDKVIVRNSFLRQELGICNAAFYSAIKWLEDNYFLQRTSENGMNAYLLNPSVTACGTSSLKKRKALWSINF